MAQETLQLFALYGPEGSEFEDRRIIDMMDETPPVTGKIQASKFLDRLRRLHREQVTGHTPGQLGMRVLYPAEDDIPSLSEEQLSLKIARHSHCSLCSCSGLRPPVGVEVASDDSLSLYQTKPAYLSECQCGHDVPSHGVDVSILGRREYQRRGRVAVRIDELLHVRGGAFILISHSDQTEW